MQWMRMVLLGLMMVSLAACGGGGGVDEDVRGDTSIQVTIEGNGQVEHNLGASPNNPCLVGTCTWDFNPGSAVELTATPGAGCVFGGWGDDCAFRGVQLTCPLTVDDQYDVTATFNCL